MQVEVDFGSLACPIITALAPRQGRWMLSEGSVNAGDIILKVNGVETADRNEEEVIAAFNAGTVVLEVIEAGVSLEALERVATNTRVVTLHRCDSATPSFAFGFEIQQEHNQLFPVVSAVLENGPAAVSRQVYPGDVLFSINDQSTKNLTLHQLHGLLDIFDTVTLHLEAPR